jgi:5'-nucleotidase/UDP-sugar diphosphatase
VQGEVKIMSRICRIFAIALFAALLSSSAFPAGTRPVHITILHLNDLHGHILPYVDKTVSETTPVSGAAYLARMIEIERAKNPEGTVLLSAGDMFQGTPVSNIFRGRPVIEVMNYLRFDASAIGNHELDWGRGALGEIESLAKFPFLAGNIVDGNGKYLSGTRPYVILTRKNMRIGIIGLTTPETVYSTMPASVSGLVFEDPVKVLPSLIREVRDKGARIVIALTHLGLQADKELASQVAGIDVIVGGHTHTVVSDPVKIGKTIIVQAGCYGVYLGVLQLEVDPSDNEVLSYTEKNELHTVFAGKGRVFDARVAGIAGKYEGKIKTEFAREVGQTSVDLVRRADGESNIGDLVCDAIRESAGADAAFFNSGGIRSDLKSGPVTMEGVYTSLPFDIVVVSMELTGKQILDVLEQSAGKGVSVLQVSGVVVHYDLKNAAGSRVVKATINGEPIDPSKTYRVAVSDFLAASGDNYGVFKEGGRNLYGENVRDAFVSYLQKHSPVNPQVQGRILVDR